MGAGVRIAPKISGKHSGIWKFNLDHLINIRDDYKYHRIESKYKRLFQISMCDSTPPAISSLHPVRSCPRGNRNATPTQGYPNHTNLALGPTKYLKVVAEGLSTLRSTNHLHNTLYGNNSVLRWSESGTTLGST